MQVSQVAARVYNFSYFATGGGGGVLVRVLVLVLVFVRREVAMLCIAGCEPLI